MFFYICYDIANFIEKFYNKTGVKMKQLEEMGKEDDMELVDKATDRDRQWDDWKDMNPKGYGVTNKI